MQETAIAKGGNFVKRVKAACICQTVHFMLKEGVGSVWAESMLRKSLEIIKEV